MLTDLRFLCMSESVSEIFQTTEIKVTLRVGYNILRGSGYTRKMRALLFK